jgi:hypothetical protein
MKKKILYGLIALLSVSVLFLACSTGTSNDDTTIASIPVDPDPIAPIPPVSPAAKAQDLANALGSDKVTVTGSIVTIDNSGTPVSVSDVSIPLGVTIVVPTGETLTLSGTDNYVAGNFTVEGTVAVASGGELTVAGDLTVEGGVTVESGAEIAVAGALTVPSGGDFTVEGEINNTGDIVVEGTYTIDDNATGTNTGTVIVEDGGIIKSDGYIDGDGTNTVKAGGTVYFNDGTGPAEFGGSSAVFDVETDSGTVSYGNGFYSIDSGSVTLKANSSGSMWFDSVNTGGTKLIIKAGAKFVIDNNGKTLEVLSALADPAIQGAAGAEIEVKGDASFVIYTTSPSTNFYDNSGTEIPVGTPLAGKTYAWNENADGSGAAGWKALP